MLLRLLGHLTDGQGVIYKAVADGSTPLIPWKTGLNGSDGAWIDRANRLIYISELKSATVQVYKIDDGTLLRQFVAPGMTQLDDLTLDPMGQYLYGADLAAGNVVRFAIDGSGSGEIIISGLQSPTSVRFGSGVNFSSNSLFITEGGGMGPGQNTRRVLEVPLWNHGDSNHSGSGLSPGAAAGITFAVCLAIFGGIVAFLVIRGRNAAAARSATAGEMGAGLLTA